MSLLGCRGTKTAQIDMEYKIEETVNLQDKKDMVEEDIVQAVDNTEENKKVDKIAEQQDLQEVSVAIDQYKIVRTIAKVNVRVEPSVIKSNQICK